MIDKTAIIGRDAKIGNNVQIGPYAIIEGNVQISDNCIIAAHAIIRAGTILEKNVYVDSFACIGGDPQDISFNYKIQSGVHIGEGTTIREGVTIHRATIEGGLTKIGKNCFLMGYCHIAHDCILGNDVKIANGALLAGHVHMSDHIFMGGNAVIHQNLQIGEGVIIAGCARLNLDIPPFLIVSEATEINGLNLIGIKRRGFGQTEVSDLKCCFKEILDSPGSPYEKAAKATQSNLAKTELGKIFLSFFEKRGKKGCVHQNHIGRSRGHA
jgi:UDP-N-acetylglucosamine acyltransferase